MICLISFLKTAGVEVDTASLKVHLACWNGHEQPLDVFFAGGFKQWQEQPNKRNFQCAQIISLIDLGQGRWLFAGVYKILNCRENTGGGAPFLYTTQLVPTQDEWIGRTESFRLLVCSITIYNDYV